MKEIKIINKESDYYGKTGLATKTADGKYICVYLRGQRTFQIFYAEEIAVRGNATVYEATHLAFNLIGATEFPIRSLVDRVRSICERPELMDGTILRRLRELRADGKINFICIDNHKAIYQKA